jgi:hypothetical protein
LEPQKAGEEALTLLCKRLWSLTDQPHIGDRVMRGALVTSRLSIVALPIILPWLQKMVITQKVSMGRFY